jgi:hypothetical protein
MLILCVDIKVYFSVHTRNKVFTDISKYNIGSFVFKKVV